MADVPQRTHYDRVTHLINDTEFNAICLPAQMKGDARLAVLRQLDTDTVFLQVRARDLADNPQNGRKWYVSPHSCDSEIVMTGLAAWLAWFEHEVRESYTFRGVRPGNPHWDVNALAADPPRTECRLP